MDSHIDFDALAENFWNLLRQHGLRPVSFGISFAIPHDQFEAIAIDHPGQHPEMILLRRGNEWYIQVKLERRLEDFPPGIIMTPDEDK